VLFGHHFAAIAGPGPLVGPVLAAQWGYAPGFIWIIIRACLAGAVHEAAKPLAEGLVMRTNNAGALLVLEKRVLQHLVADNLGA